MTLEELLEIKIAEYLELKPFVKASINKGVNSFGFNERTLILVDNSNWDYIPEDGLYELNENSRMSVSIN
jgi:hypothetical protein